MVAVSRSDSPQLCSSLASPPRLHLHETDDLGILQVARVVSVSPKIARRSLAVRPQHY